MKRYFVVLSCCWIIAGLFNYALAQNEFKQGVNFIELTMPRLEHTVWKIYSVYCPFCNKYEKNVTPDMIKNLPPNTHYEAIFLADKGQYGQTAAKVLAALTVIGPAQYEAAKKIYYYEANEQKEKNIKNKGEENYINIGLKAAGVSKQQYEMALATPQAQALLAHWSEIAGTIAKIQGVPAIVVNGRYLIKTDSVTSKEMLDQLIAYLLKQ